MGSVVALALLVGAAYIAVLAGGIAFEVTGLDRDMARFQALSAFTGTEFTTRASESIVEHGTRRRIALVLIVLGYAGAASVIATLISSLEFDSYMQSLGNIGLAVGIGGLIEHLDRELEPADANTQFEVGEHVLVFGRLANIQAAFGPPDEPSPSSSR